MVRDPPSGQKLRIKETEHRKQRDGKNSQSQQDMPAPTAAEPPADKDSGAEQKIRNVRRRRSRIHFPLRIDQVQMQGQQRLAEIEPEDASGHGQSFPKAFRLKGHA